MADTDAGTVQRARPRYQVFISSTWDDLKDIRAKVTWEVLKAGHIPAGMENFPATDDRGWDIIRRTIDRSDYYLIIVAGRYGTYDPKIDMSWTRREYDYARSKGMPVLAFIREPGHVPSTELDKEEADRARLAAFIATLNQNHLKQAWTTPDDLATKVVHALRSHIDNDEEDGKPRPGWYRGDQLPSLASLDEFARLSAENAGLKARLEEFLAEQKTEQLSLVNQDGSPFSDHVAQVTRIHVTAQEDRSHVPGFAMPMGGGGRNPEEVAAFARVKGQTVWFKLRIVNAGSKAARNVVADFEVKNCGKVLIHQMIDPPEAGPFAVPRLQSRAFYRDPSQHCFVESSSCDGAVGKVRQRIKLVAAGGGHEDLIRIGFCSAGHSPSRLDVSYTIRSEDGSITEGSVAVSVSVKEKSMTEKELCAG